jgi:hypothetical protein
MFRFARADRSTASPVDVAGAPRSRRMMFDTVAGLGLHPLVVHATEVLVPTAALVVAMAALWPMFLRWARFLPFVLSC